MGDASVSTYFSSMYLNNARLLLFLCDWAHTHCIPILNGKEKRGRMVSFEHRLKMCQLAFAHLNEVDREKSSQQRNKQTKIVVSDMEYMSWKNAVNDMYVH